MAHSIKEEVEDYVEYTPHEMVESKEQDVCVSSVKSEPLGIVVVKDEIRRQQPTLLENSENHKYFHPSGVNNVKNQGLLTHVKLEQQFSDCSHENISLVKREMSPVELSGVSISTESWLNWPVKQEPVHDTDQRKPQNDVEGCEKAPHNCNICDKSLSKSSSLKTLLSKQTGEKSYHCSLCSKSFSRLGFLRNHTLIHAGEKPHRCNLCDKSFTQAGNLRNHMLKHSGKKPHSCTLCDRSFVQAGTLKRHMLIHSGEKPFTCTVCKKSFTLSYTLKRHLLMHTGEKPFTCTVCEKSFSEAGTLKTHLLIHTGEKPHKCSLCKKSFTQSNHLKNHMLKHSDEK